MTSAPTSVVRSCESDVGTLFLHQLEDIQRVATRRGVYLRRDGPRLLTGAAAAVAGRHRDILLTVGRERHREALHRGLEPHLPQHIAGPDVERAEVAIEIADEDHAARGA